MNELLMTRSTDRGGVFTREDALACGYTDAGLRVLVRTGACRRLARGVYGLAGSTAPVSREDRHRQLTRGLLLRFAGRAVASHHSALLLHALPAHAVDLARAHLTTLTRSHGRVGPEFAVHRRLDGVEPTLVGDWPTVPIAIAVIQTAAHAGSTAGIVAADAALHRQQVTAEDLELAARQAAGWPGGREAQLTAQLADQRSESVGESRLRLVFHALRIPVTPQFSVEDGDRVIARADFRVRGTRLLVEFDGLLKYRGEGGAEAVAREKQREDRVRRQGWGFERFTWDDLERPSLVAARVREGCRRVA